MSDMTITFIFTAACLKRPSVTLPEVTGCIVIRDKQFENWSYFEKIIELHIDIRTTDYDRPNYRFQ